MTPPRCVLPGQTLFVTCRAVSRQFRLLPTPAVRKLVLYGLAVYLNDERYAGRILLHEFCFLSNHYHLLLTDLGGLLPDFMRDVNSLISRGLNAHRGTRGTNFEKGYNAVVVTDPERALKHAVYTLANPCKAHLVVRARQWGGATSATMAYGEALVIERPAVGIWKYVEDVAPPPTRHGAPRSPDRAARSPRADKGHTGGTPGGAAHATRDAKGRGRAARSARADERHTDGTPGGAAHATRAAKGRGRAARSARADKGHTDGIPGGAADATRAAKGRGRAVMNPARARRSVGSAPTPPLRAGHAGRRPGRRRRVPKNRTRAAYAGRSALPERAELVLTRPDVRPELGDAELRAQLLGRLHQRELELKDERRRRGHGVLGMERVLMQRWHECPGSREDLFGSIPVASGRSQWAVAEAKQRRGAFLDAYAAARRAYLAGDHDVEFPPGTWLMVRRYGARCAPPPAPPG